MLSNNLFGIFHLQLTEDEFRQQGKNPCVIPVGGSNSIGALGYVNAAFELKSQLQHLGTTFDYIVHATSSGGTQAGLVVGSKLTQLGAELIECAFIVELPDLKGREQIKGVPIYTMTEFEGL